MTDEELKKAIFIERIERARRIDPVERSLSGERLFLEACARVRVGLRHQYPEADEDRIEELFKERMNINERLENAKYRRWKNTELQPG